MTKHIRGNYTVFSSIRHVFTAAQEAQLKSLFASVMGVPVSHIEFDYTQIVNWTYELWVCSVGAYPNNIHNIECRVIVDQHKDLRRKLNIIWRTLRRNNKLLSNTEIYRIGGDAALKQMGITLKRKPKR